MPRDTNGNVSPPSGTVVNTGDTILPSQHNPVVIEYADLLTQSLSRDGQGGMRAPLQMNGFRIVNVGDGSDPNDVATVSQAQGVMPVGSVIDYAGNAAPAGWMLCHGQSLSRADYAALFAVVGAIYGSTSGATFNLPDLRGRVVAGLDNMGGPNAERLSGIMASTTLGGAGGAKEHALTIAQMPSHNHTAGASDSGNHAHFGLEGRVGTAGAGNGLVQSAGGSGYGFMNQIQTAAGGIHSHTITIGHNGSGESHPNVQPTMVMNKIIKVR